MGDSRRAVAYLRVSTDDQQLGPEAQRAQIEAWAMRVGVIVIDWKQESDVSGGAELVDRPELLAALSSVRTNRAGILVVAKRDRLARDVEKVREITRMVVAAGAVLKSADGMSDLQGSGGRLTMTMLDAFAEHERDVIKERTKAALDAKRVRGEAVGPPPFGFKVGPGGRLELNPKEVKVVLAIARLKRADATERAIVEELAAAGLRSRKGTPLSQTQVHRIIARLHWDGDKVRIDR